MSRSYSRLIIYLRDVLLHTFISIRRHFGNQKGTEAERHIAIVSGIVTGVVTQLDNKQRSPWESALRDIQKTAARETITGKVSARLVRSAAIGHFFPVPSK